MLGLEAPHDVVQRKHMITNAHILAMRMKCS